MLDLSLIEGFEWDNGNARKSVEKHDVSQAEAEQVFAGGPLLSDDLRHSQSEARFQALGEADNGRKLHIAFTLRGRKIRVISARDMNRKERDRYDQNA